MNLKNLTIKAIIVISIIILAFICAIVWQVIIIECVMIRGYTEIIYALPASLVILIVIWLVIQRKKTLEKKNQISNP